MTEWSTGNFHSALGLSKIKNRTAPKLSFLKAGGVGPAGSDSKTLLNTNYHCVINNINYRLKFQ